MQAKNKLKTESAVFLLIFVGILALANILSVRFFFRGDLTEDGTFTLSGASISLVKNLADKVVVKAYFTKNLPGRFATLERQVRDLLEEYAERSGGKMEVEFIDPADNPEEEKVAKSLGIEKMPNPDIEKDQATVKEGYRGISFSHGENTDVIAAVDSPVGLEYQITSVLKKITGQKADLGFLVGHGEPEIEAKQDPNQQMAPQDPRAQGAYRNIRNNLDTYNYKQLDLKQGKVGIPSGTKALVVAGTRGDIEDAELYKIDQFILNGGSVAFFVDGVNIDVEQGQFQGMPPQYKTTVNETNLREFLRNYGVELDKSLVMDAQSADFPARCPPIPLTLPRPYPAWPLVTAFGKEHPMTHRLGSLTLPYATAVRVTETARKDSAVKAAEIAFSSGNSWMAGGEGVVVDPCGITASKDLESSIPLAAAVSGTFTSFFKGKELPKEQAKEGEAELQAPDTGSFVESSKAPGRLVVVGSAGLPGDETISYLARIDRRQAMNNFTFVQNVLDWMTSEEELIAVRMKTMDDPPLEQASETAKGAAKYGNIIGIPFALIAFGLVRWRIRRSKKG